ncbi:MAG TPA: hypothetical protein DDZ51_05425 [Planctomycetaceae bacterium]|nr:hypothetical protein [Planctomycetaceae bacterium]
MLTGPLACRGAEIRQLAWRTESAKRLSLSLAESLIDDPRPWHAVVSSRLGRTPLAHHLELATLYRWVQQTVEASAVPLTIASTAAERWVIRACGLLGVAPLRLELGSGDFATGEPGGDRTSRVFSQNPKITRDEVAIMLADRVDVAMVRRGGTIHRLLLQRLAQGEPATVRVLVPVEPWGQPVSPGSSRVIQELIDAGAVGYCCHWDGPDDNEPCSHDSVRASEKRATSNLAASCDVAVRQLLNHSDAWLVHCTRGRQAAWPGQSDEQFFDWLMLSAPQAADLSPLATLQRIVTQQQLIGSGRTTRSGRPVVCFSDRPLWEVIGQRVFRSHLGRWDAEPFGIAIRKEAVLPMGAQPVIYFDPKKRSAEPPGLSIDANADQSWRLQPVGVTYDWTAEREWRLPVALDLRQLAVDDVVVFVASDKQCGQIIDSKWPIISIESLQRTWRGTVAT